MTINICIVTADMFAGGAERVIAQLSNYLVQRNYNIKIITIYDANIYYHLNSDINVISIGRKSDNKLINKLKQYTRLREIIKHDKPDIVLTMPEDTGVYVLVSLIGLNIPIIVSERNNPWMMPDVKFTRVLRWLVYPFASGIIFQTEGAKSFFSKKIQKKGIILSNPVEASRIPLKYEGQRKKKVVAVGRLASQKNYPLLIRAFSKFRSDNKEYTLSIYGEGDERYSLERLISSLEMQDIIFLEGRSADVLNKINDAAFFVLSSNYEGLPNVLIEALCMGLPCISTDCPSGGPRQLIIDGINGLLIPTDDEEAMIGAMNKMKDSQFAKKIGDNAYMIREKLTSEDIFIEWEDYLFKQVNMNRCKL